MAHQKQLLGDCCCHTNHVQLCCRKIAGQHSKTAIWRNYESVTVNMLLRRPDPLENFFDRFNPASRHHYRAKNDGVFLK